jgi:hypothetical protein
VQESGIREFGGEALVSRLAFRAVRDPVEQLRQLRQQIREGIKRQAAARRRMPAAVRAAALALCREVFEYCSTEGAPAPSAACSSPADGAGKRSPRCP